MKNILIAFSLLLMAEKILAQEQWLVEHERFQVVTKYGFSIGAYPALDIVNDTAYYYLAGVSCATIESYHGEACSTLESARLNHLRSAPSILIRKARIKRNYAGDFLIEDSTEALNEKQRKILLKNFPFALKILNRGDRYLINDGILTFPEYPPPISRFSLTSTAVVSGASAIVDSIGAPAALYFDCLTKNFSGSNGDDVKSLSKIAEEYFNTEYVASKNNTQHLKNSRSKIMKDMLSTKLGKAFMSRTVGKLLGCSDVEEFEATGNF